jgi:hypothetical protein
MSLRTSNHVAITLCDFGYRGRADVLQYHLSEESAKRAYKKIRKIYHEIYGWRVWQEVMSGHVINDTSKSKGTQHEK